MMEDDRQAVPSGAPGPSRSPGRGSLRQTLTLTMLLMAVVPALVGGLLLGIGGRFAIRAQVFRHMQSIAEDACLDLQHILDAHVDATRRFVHLPLVLEASEVLASGVPHAGLGPAQAQELLSEQLTLLAMPGERREGSAVILSLPERQPLAWVGVSAENAAKAAAGYTADQLMGADKPSIFPAHVAADRLTPVVDLIQTLPRSSAGEDARGEAAASEVAADEAASSEAPSGEDARGEAPAGEDASSEAAAAVKAASDEAPSGEDARGEAARGEDASGQTPSGAGGPAAVLIWSVALEPTVYAALDARKGLGRTGEIYLVDRNSLAIRDLRYIPNSAFREVVRTQSAQRALSGEAATTVSLDYRGKPVVAAVGQVRATGWGLVAKMDAAEAYAGIARLTWLCVALMAVLLFTGTVAARALSGALLRPVEQLSAAMQAVAEGDTSVRLNLARTDELGQMAHNFDTMTVRVASVRTSLETALDQAQETRDYLDKLLDYANAPIVVWDPDLHITRFNRAFERLTGRSEENVLGEPLSSLLPEADRETYMERIRAASAGENWDATEIPVLHAYGSMRTVLWNSAAVYGSDGETVVAAIAQGQDITDRKAAEESLRQTLERLQGIVTSSPAAIIIQSPTHGVELYSPAAERLFGWKAEEVLGLRLPLHLGERFEAEAPALTQRVAAGETITGHETQWLCRDGSLIDVSISMADLPGGEGESGRSVVVVMDNTDRVRARREAEESSAMRTAMEAAEAANRTKSAFLANMSHEIRTPLNAILGFSQLIQRDPALPPHQRAHLETINRSGEQLLLLIDDILNMAKIEAGRATLSPTTFDLHALLDNLELTFRMLTDAKHVQLLVERGEEVPRYVVTDEEKLRQVLTNLLGNAVKFTEEGGIVLRVSARRSEAAELRLLAEVEDSGPGVAEDELGKLFQPFQQTTTGVRTLKGTGLGLAISQEFAHLMGGTVTVSSREGKGSTFRLEIGLEEGAAEAVVPKEVFRPVTGQQPGQPQYRILVADDNEDNRKLLELTLAAVGFEVRGAADGQLAMQAYEEWRPHLILMDMRMPVMDGFEAIRQIRASVGGDAIPIIVVTASPVIEHREEALRIGASDFLSKPFREVALFAKIRAQLGVEYTYAEEGPEAPASPADASQGELTAEAVAALPAQLVSDLYAATVDADRDVLFELISAAESYDAGLGQGLRSLAQRFDYRTLLGLLQTKGNE